MRQARGAAPQGRHRGGPQITAAPDLIRLAGREVLQTVGERRSTRYYPNLPGWVEVEGRQTRSQAPLTPSPSGRGLG